MGESWCPLRDDVELIHIDPSSGVGECVEDGSDGREIDPKIRPQGKLESPNLGIRRTGVDINI